MFENIGPTEDDGMRSVREGREARAYLRRGALSFADESQGVLT